MLKKSSPLAYLPPKKRKQKVYLYLFFFIINTLLILILYKPEKSDIQFPSFDLNKAPELAEISTHKFESFQDLSNYFRKLSNEKGAKYAFGVLKYSKLPPQTDLHLLAHVVGDILYKQEGSEGIKVCTDDFRNACSHSIVIGTLLSKGENSLPLLTKLCESAPGGPGAYTMCFHGLGHGVLSFTGYDLEKATKLCAKTGTEKFDYRESSECIGGTIMEMIGGVHDRKAWEKQVGKYLKKDSPLSPCNTNIIPDKAKGLCYTYLTPHLFELAGADLGNPSPSTFPKAFGFCSLLSITDNNRNDCFGGFGKDFVVLVNSRDIRSIDNMSKEQLGEVVTWCKMANDKKGTNACLQSALQSLFWGGENNPQASFTLCSILDGEYRSLCYASLGGTIDFYIKKPEYKKSLCAKLPIEFQKPCTSN